jgi:hypothetical protein
MEAMNKFLECVSKLESSNFRQYNSEEREEISSKCGEVAGKGTGIGLVRSGILSST